MSRRHRDHKRPTPEIPPPAKQEDTDPDWSKQCDVCGQTPIVPLTGLCGPCTFGEADTVGGNW